MKNILKGWEFNKTPIQKGIKNILSGGNNLCLETRDHVPKTKGHSSELTWFHSSFWSWRSFSYPWHILLVWWHYTLFVFLLISLVGLPQYSLKAPLCLLYSVISTKLSTRPFFFFFPKKWKVPCLADLISPPWFQLPYIHDSQSRVSRTDSFWGWEPNNYCLLDTSLKFHKCLKLNTFKMKLSFSQTPFSSWDPPPP